MIVISDTTPLLSLLKINRLNLLKEIFKQVIIPQAVFDELTVDKRFETEAEQIKNASYIIVKTVASEEAVSILKKVAGLDRGESEAIILTDELNADLLLMDEARGRTVSAQMGFKIMGTIGLLLAAYEENILTNEEVKECIDGLQQAGRHISHSHYQLLLDKLKS
jgi:predicted nucleic acid-binding protein